MELSLRRNREENNVYSGYSDPGLEYYGGGREGGRSDLEYPHVASGLVCNPKRREGVKSQLLLLRT